MERERKNLNIKSNSYVKETETEKNLSKVRKSRKMISSSRRFLQKTNKQILLLTTMKPQVNFFC